MNDTIYWIWIQQAVGYYCNINNLIVDKIEDPKYIYGKSFDDINSYGVFTAKTIYDIMSTSIKVAQDIYKKCEQFGIKVYTPNMSKYPDRLKNIASMPLVIYVKGDKQVFETIDDTPAISIIGARDFSTYGRKVAIDISSDLAELGFTIVSGLAIGIDAQAHKGAVRADGKTIAVVGAGLDIDYPKQNGELRQLIEQNGCVISEYPPTTTPNPKHFPMRNRIMAGISLGILVVEAGEKSGTLITAGHALTQGKDIFAIPNDIYDEKGKGTLKLIKQGAKVVTCATDIFEEYFWIYKDKIKTDNLKKDYTLKGEKQKNIINKSIEDTNDIKEEKTKKKKKAPAYLTEEQINVFEALCVQPKSADELMLETDLTMYKLLSTLTELEIYGLATAYAGKRYSY